MINNLNWSNYHTDSQWEWCWFLNIKYLLPVMLPVIFVVNEYCSSLLQDKVNLHLGHTSYNCSSRNTLHSYLKRSVLNEAEVFKSIQDQQKWSYPATDQNEQQSMNRLAVKALWGRFTSVHFERATGQWGQLQHSTDRWCDFITQRVEDGLSLSYSRPRFDAKNIKEMK